MFTTIRREARAEGPRPVPAASAARGARPRSAMGMR